MKEYNITTNLNSLSRLFIVFVFRSYIVGQSMVFHCYSIQISNVYVSNR